MYLRYNVGSKIAVVFYIGTLIGTLKAYVEGDPNAVIFYSCASRFFEVNKTTGETHLTSVELDYEVSICFHNYVNFC